MLDGPRREELERLRAEITALVDGPVCGREWRAWYQAVCILLKDAYGFDSEELAGFLGIRFEIDDMVDHTRAKVEVLLPGIPIASIGEDRHYRERLWQANEYLLSLSIRSPEP